MIIVGKMVDNPRRTTNARLHHLIPLAVTTSPGGALTKGGPPRKLVADFYNDRLHLPWLGISTPSQCTEPSPLQSVGCFVADRLADYKITAINVSIRKNLNPVGVNWRPTVH